MPVLRVQNKVTDSGIEMSVGLANKKGIRGLPERARFNEVWDDLSDLKQRAEAKFKVASNDEGR